MDVHEVHQDGRKQMQKEEVFQLYREGTSIYIFKETYL